MVFPSKERAPPAIPINLPLEKSPANGGAEAIAAPGGDGASIAQMYILRACRGNIPLSPMPPTGGRSAAEPQEGA